MRTLIVILSVLLSVASGQSTHAQLMISVSAIDSTGIQLVDVGLTGVSSHPFNGFMFEVETTDPGIEVIGVELDGTIAQGLTFVPATEQLPLLQGANAPSRPIRLDGTLLRLRVSVAPDVRGGEIQLKNFVTRLGVTNVRFSPIVPKGVVMIDNTRPIGADDRYEVAVGGTVSGNVMDNDSDADGDALFVSIKQYPQNGSLVLLEDGNFSYQHTGTAPASDSFSYHLSDKFGGTSEAKVLLLVK